MKNDKVVEEVREICRHLDALDAITTFDEAILDNLNSNYERLFNRLQTLIKPLAEPTTDIDEVRRRLTWAMGVQGSPVAMLGDYEIDWIMNFFLPYLKGGE